MFFHKTTFNFSDDAKSWIIDRYQNRFDRDFFHALDDTQFNSQAQVEWRTSLVGKELTEFLALYNCDTNYYGIGVFVSNKSSELFGNPHMDTKFSNGNPYSIKSRFNVMVLGNSDDPMVWWDNMLYGDSRLIEAEYTNVAGKKYTSKGIPGNSVAERWNYLGKPTKTEPGLLTPSAFVRTDCAHSVILSPQPRLIITVALDKSIEEIVGSRG